MQVYTSLQTDNHASTPSGQMPFLLPNQQRQTCFGVTNHNEAALL